MMRIKFVSIFVVLCIVFSAMYMPGVSFASGSSQPLPRVDFSASSICSASGLSRNTFYKYSSSSASAEFKVTASTKETKTFDFSANGISTDWSYGNTIVIPMYNKYATGDVVNFVMIFNDDYTLSFGLLESGYIVTSKYAGMKITPIFVFALLDVGMFFLTSYIMHKKVNLK